MTTRPTVHLLTLGCARNDVDSEELAARLDAQGWDVTRDDGPADVVVVNTCGFVAAAKQESIDAILQQHDDGTPVVAVGCLAERYGKELAAELPEAAAVIGFDGYEALGDTLHRVAAGQAVPSHAPQDRRQLLPISPVQRPGVSHPPGHGRPGGIDLPGSDVLRARLSDAPWAPLKIASGCDRRCAFCAIPRFRGAFVSRRPHEIVAEARWLIDSGVRELLLVSENSTSYGKDLGDPRLLESLLPELAALPGLGRARVSYLQPAELRPGLIDVIAGVDGVAAYFDLSFQHASGPLLRRMRRFGDADAFLDLIGRIRGLAPEAGIRSNVIVGFPGESDDDVTCLEDFLAAAQLDAVGVFGYSDEDQTEAEGLPGKLDPDEIAERVDRITASADYASEARAAQRIGTTTEVLVLEVGHEVRGRADFQGPEDGDVSLAVDAAQAPSRAARGPSAVFTVGDIVTAVITGSQGVDLHAEVRP